MLQNIKQLYGMGISATDGDIGQVKDFYFDDKTWAIRYIVAETGTWLTGRQVLLSPHAFGEHAFGRADAVASTHVLHSHLTRKQIEDSPSIDAHRPVSRQYEEDYYRYYGWPTYWQDIGPFGLGVVPAISSPTPGNLAKHELHQRDDIHLRSTLSMAGYHLQATDGQIGSVSGFNVDGRIWMIRELVVETGHWYAGKSILILPENINRISYENSTVYVNLCMEDLKQTTNNDVAQVGAGHR
jgi:hypothetical protein